MFTFPQVGRFYRALPEVQGNCASLASPSAKQENATNSIVPSRDWSRHLIREPALTACRINRRRHVVIGRTVLYGCVRVTENCNQRGVDFCVRTPAHRASIDVVARNGRGTGIPG